MTNLKATLRLADRAIATICRWGVVAGLATRVLARATEITFAAYDEIGELATIWMVMLGILALWREGALYRVNFMLGAFPGIGLWLEIVAQLASLSFAVVMVWVGGKYAVGAREVTAFMQIDKIWYFGAIPVCGAVATIYSLIGIRRTVIHLCGRHRRTGAPAGIQRTSPVEHL